MEITNQLAAIIAQIIAQLELYKQLPEGVFDSSLTVSDALELIDEVENVFFPKKAQNAAFTRKYGTTEEYQQELERLSRQLERELKIFY